MHTAIRTTLTLALTMSASSNALLAQSTTAPIRLASASHAAVAVNPYDPATVRSRLDIADALFLQGRISAARREYLAVAEMQRANNVLPTEALWKLAELYHSERSVDRTASVLNGLAEEAEHFGDPQVQAKALLEATILYQKARMPQKAVACAERLNALMASPFISDELRSEVQRRIAVK